MSDNMGYVPPTISPVCNMVLDYLEKVHAGEADDRQLAALLVDQAASIARTREEILAKCGKDESGCLDLPPEVIEEVEASLDEYGSCIDEAVRYANERNEEAYEKAVEGLMKVGCDGRLPFEGYTPDEGRMGPTAMPMLNVLIRLCDGFAEEQVSKCAIRRTIFSIVINARVAAYELDQRQDDYQYERDILIGAYCNFADTVLYLKDVLDNGVEAIRPELENIVKAGTTLREAVENFSLSMASKGPSKIDQTNIILNLFKGLREGGVEKEAFMAALGTFQKNMEGMLREAESIAALPHNCDDITAEMGGLRTAIEEHLKAADMIAEAVENETDIEEATKLLVEAGDRLCACKEKFDAIGEKAVEEARQIPCVRCGAYNDPASRTCSQCGARMINSTPGASSSTVDFQEGVTHDQDSAGGELVMTKNLVILFEAVNKMAEGVSTPEEYGHVLDWFRGLVEDNLLNMPPEPEVDVSGFNDEEIALIHSMEEQVAVARADIEAGAHDMIEAVETLRLYVDDKNTAHFVDGVRALRDSSIKVQTAARAIEELINSCRAQAGLGGQEVDPDKEEDEDAGEAESSGIEIPEEI